MGDNIIADLEHVGVAQRQANQPLCGDSQKSEVRWRIGAYELRFNAPAVGQRDADALRVAHHVMVGQHKSAIGINDDSRSSGEDLPLGWHGTTKIPAIKGILVQGIVFARCLRLNGDADD